MYLVQTQYVVISEQVKKRFPISDLIEICYPLVVCNSFQIKAFELKVSTQNIPAVSFYRKQGFIDTDIQPPWIIMKCILS